MGPTWHMGEHVYVAADFTCLGNRLLSWIGSTSSAGGDSFLLACA
jgi:hypothetical protein